MLNTKYTFWSFPENAGGAFSEYLERMAGKGWYLKKMTSSGICCFERGKAGIVHCAAVVMPDSSQFDSEEREEARRLRELCEEAGWELRYGGSVWQIFYSTQENPIPIETDEALRLEAVQKTMLSPMRIIAMLLTTAILSVPAVLQWKDPEQFFSSYKGLSDFCFLVFLCFYLMETTVIAPLLWSCRAKRCIRHGEKLPGPALRRIMGSQVLLYILITAFIILREMRDLRSALEFISGYGVILLVIAVDLKILTVVKNRDGESRGVKIVIYTVCAVAAGWFLTTVLNHVLDHFMPEGKETPVYERVMEFPVDFEEMGYEPVKEWLGESGKTFLAAYQKETGGRQEYQGKDQYVEMSYTVSRFPYIIQRVRQQYPKSRYNYTDAELTEQWTEGDIIIERFHLGEAFTQPDLNDPSGRDLYIITGPDRILTLEFTAETDRSAAEPAIQAMKSTKLLK